MTLYTTLSLAAVGAELEQNAREAEASFGALDARQLNWQPGAGQWSVAQCLEHLVTTNRLTLRAAEEALSGTQRPTVWQRLPVLPGVLGRALVRSQSPDQKRKYKSPPSARPAASEIPSDVVPRFVAQHREAVARAQALDEGVAARTIMASPFLKVITYSVLDGWRLVAAHDRRHLAQASRVSSAPGFPR